MKSTLYIGVCLSLASACVTAPAFAAAPPMVIAAQAQEVAGGRALTVLVAQSEIKSDINPSNLAAATGGGLLGGLLAAAQDAARAKKAEAAIQPLRIALGGFDADALASETTRAGLATVPWMQAAPTFSKDSSILGKSAMLDAAAAAQTAFIEYSYDVSPDFTAIRVVARMDFANKAVTAASAKKPETRLLPKNLAFTQTITSIVSLPSPGADLEANAALWSADQGKLARAALAKAFGQVAALLPRSLALTAEDLKAMNGRDHVRQTAGGFTGRVQETAPSGTLLWSNGFIFVQPLS